MNKSMLRNDGYIDRTIGAKLLLKNAEERSNHKSSGKLSASMLGQPLQWQVLKYYGVKPKEIDEYVIRKMLRGKKIEDWLLSEMDSVVEQQKFVEYRGCIGYADALVDTANFDFNLGVIPHEIKSVANAKYKRILQRSEPDRSHKLQAGLYALALNAQHFAIDYIASDDLRILSYVFDTAQVKDEIDTIIDRYELQISRGTIPVFVAEEDWQANKKYCNYPDWIDLKEECSA